MIKFSLIDFLSDPTLNSLRLAMGAPLVPPFADNPELSSLSAKDLEDLGSRGIDLNDISKIEAAPDGTIIYKGKRVLLYIRDVNSINRRAEPRYHVAFCKTLEDMQKNSRFGRYVLANRDNGVFKVNFINGGGEKDIELDVCQNCLRHLRWNGFSLSLDRDSRELIVSKFTLLEFFKKYPKDLISVKPKYNTDTAPTNDYPPDWQEISNSIKLKRGYVCEQCSLNLRDNQRFLHAHHINGLKNDCRPENIKLLCIGCHAAEPMHGHMKAMPEYTTFMKIYHRRRIQGI